MKASNFFYHNCIITAFSTCSQAHSVQ